MHIWIVHTVELSSSCVAFWVKAEGFFLLLNRQLIQLCFIVFFVGREVLCWTGRGVLWIHAKFFQDQLTLALESPVIHVETVKVEGNMSEEKMTLTYSLLLNLLMRKPSVEDVSARNNFHENTKTFKRPVSVKLTAQGSSYPWYLFIYFN